MARHFTFYAGILRDKCFWWFRPLLGGFGTVSVGSSLSDMYFCLSCPCTILVYPEGHGDLVNGLIRGITKHTICDIGGINLLTKCP